MGKKILIVEDDFLLAQLYERVLIQAGYVVQLAMDGAKGLELSLEKPDLIFLDIMLPKVNGIEVLRKIMDTEETRTIPVYLLSNLAQEDIIEKALEMGARGYILKVDILPQDLVKFVNEFFAKGNPDYRGFGADDHGS